MARLMAWQCKIMMSGKHPTRGFYDEEFQPKSHRAKLAGQPLAGGLLGESCFVYA